MKRELYCKPDLLNAVNQWLNSLKTEQNLSKHTLRAYTIDIDHFLSFLSSYEGQEISLNILSEMKIFAARAWLATKANKEISKSSRARSVSSIRNFFQYLDDQGIMHNPVMKMLTTPKIPHKIPRPVDLHQAKKILETSMEQADDWTAQRDFALFSLLYGSGLRIQEALSLKIKDLDTSTHEDDMLRILGKGGKERFVPLLNIVRERIQTYLKSCPYPQTPERLLFLGLKGGPLNQGIAQKSMRQIRTLLGLPDNVTPHSLRHSYATHLMGENGLNLREIQELLGHSSLSTTQRYTEVNSEELLRIHKQAHKRNKVVD